MPKCKVKKCTNKTIYKQTTRPYCTKHLGRIRRYGHTGVNLNAWRCVEKLPHDIVNDFIIQNHKTMIDKKIAKALTEKGIKEASVWNIKYRRRKLGIKKYLYGDIKKHKAWVRLQAIKKYGTACELCGYKLSIDTHHIIPKHKGGLHTIENLMVICPNCHALITRKLIELKDRLDIKKVSNKIKILLRQTYGTHLTNFRHDNS